MNPDKLRADKDAVTFVRSFVDAGKPVAAICHAGWMLAEADVVRGKTVTSWPSIKTDLVNAGAEWVDQEVVEDGNLITSRKPDDLEAFIERNGQWERAARDLYCHRHTLRYRIRRVEELTSGRDQGAGIRVVRGSQAAYAYTNVLSRDSLVEAAKAATHVLNMCIRAIEFGRLVQMARYITQSCQIDHRIESHSRPEQHDHDRR